MSIKIRKERIINEDINKYVEVSPIGDKLREKHLRWFCHVYRRPQQDIVRRNDNIQNLNNHPKKRRKPRKAKYDD